MSSANPYAVATEQSTGSDTGATEHTEQSQLAELVNQEACRSSEIELKVIRNEIITYTYQWNGTPVETQKMQVILQSKHPEQYCVGVARMQRKDKSELQKMAGRWQLGST